jgi:hypothetical protein
MLEMTGQAQLSIDDLLGATVAPVHRVALRVSGHSAAHPHMALKIDSNTLSILS